MDSFAQLDFRIRDDEGKPINDYVFKLGATVNGKEVASKTIAHTHKNKKHPNHFTVFINLKELEPKYSYFIEIDANSDSNLFKYSPASLEKKLLPNDITKIIIEDQTTQIDVIFSRIPAANLFVFHKGNDPQLHVKWDRDGNLKKKKKLRIK